jgi:hypothetical protein
MGDGMLTKNGKKCKQSELKTREEMELNEVEVLQGLGVVKFSETEAYTEAPDKDECDSRSEVFGKSGPFWLIQLWFQGG